MTSKPSRYLTLGLLCAAGASSPLLADEKAGTEGAEESVLATTGNVELGLGYVSDSSYRFGRYSGMVDEGLYAIGAFDVRFRPGRPDSLKVEGRDLGLDSRRLLLEYGKQGQYETYLEYRELPNFKMDSAFTPYQNPGSDNLIVAPGASPTALLPMSLDTKRKRYSGGVAYFPKKKWKTSLKVSHETKDGTDWIGGGLQATNGAGVGFGQTYAVILPEPIDQSSTSVDANLDYNGEQSQWRLNLHGSLFNNENSRLRWENPGFITTGTGTGPGGPGNGGGGTGPGGPGGPGTGGGGGTGPGGPGNAAAAAAAAVPAVGPGTGPGGGGVTLPTHGQLALPPDNRFFQLGLSGSSRLNDTTRVTGTFSMGLMQQDEDFLPYGIDGSAAATAPLPRNSLDAEVRLYSARLGLTSRPTRPLRLKAQYVFDKRDDRTPRESYLYDVMDSGKNPNPAVAVSNERRSYRKHKANLGAIYRFSPDWKGSAGYEYRLTDRDYSDVEKSREHSGSAKLNWRPRDDFDATLRLGTSSREASDYEAVPPNQNPLLRKYHVADRDRDTAGILLNYAPTSKLNIGFSTDVMKDDYPDSALGLTDSDNKNYQLNAAYYPTPDIQFNGFLSHDRIESRQRGSTIASSVYQVDFDDKVDTVGLGANIDNISELWDLGINYQFSRGTGEINYSNPTRPGSSYPDLKNNLHHVRLNTSYRVNKKTRINFSAIYEKMSADDWAVDGVPAYPANQLLTLGNDTEDYDVFALMVSVQYRF